MPKKFLEDMVKSKRAMAAKKQGFKPKEIDVTQITETRVEFIEATKDSTPKNKSRYFLWFVALFSLVFCFFAVSLLFAKAKIVVNPKTENVTLNENLVADKDSDANGMSFDLVVIPGQTSKNITVTGEKNVSIPATGTVVIFNSFSSASQVLNTNTRLEGSNGKVYMTQNQITVPGISKDGTPGQIEVAINAAVPGVEYNSGPLDFTIIGFKGTPKYSKFIVRSKPGTTIAGGFVGEAPDVSPTDLAIAQGELKTTLQTELLTKATAQIPDGFILFKDATFLDTNASDISSVYNLDSTATLTLSGTFYGVILNQQELTQKIAQDNVENYDGSDVYIPGIKNLVFSTSAIPSGDASTTPTTTSTTSAPSTSSVGGSSISTLQSLNFNLSGPATIVWKLDVDKFTSDLLGKAKSDFTQILSQYPNVDSATLTITPIWKMSIPSQNKNVTVIVNYPQ